MLKFKVGDIVGWLAPGVEHIAEGRILSINKNEIRVFWLDLGYEIQHTDNQLELITLHKKGIWKREIEDIANDK